MKHYEPPFEEGEELELWMHAVIVPRQLGGEMLVATFSLLSLANQWIRANPRLCPPGTRTWSVKGSVAMQYQTPTGWTDRPFR